MNKVINKVKRSWRNGALGNERGSVLILVAITLVAIFAFAVLAIDGAVLMTSRTELHSAADAAALAGASGLINGSQDEATARAIATSGYNTAVQDEHRPVIIDESDISFPEPDVIRVETHRTVAKGDAIRTYFLQVISGSDQGNMTATAAARAFDVCGAKCIKPWSIPDRWDDTNGDGLFDAGETYDKDGTGYVAPADVGLPVTLKVGSSSESMASGVFYCVALPPLNDESGINPQTGGSTYRDNIANCNQFTIEPGDELLLEPGNKTGPTVLGMQELIDADPNAYWDGSSKAIMNSAYGLSPRVALVPFFDPMLPPVSGRDYVTVSKIGAFFLESVGPGSQVNGRFIQVTAVGQPCPYNGLGESLVKGIVLVE